MAIENNYLNISDKAYIKLLSLLMGSARAITGKLSIDELAPVIVSEARRVFDARAAWLLLYDHNEDILRMKCYLGPCEERFENLAVRPGVGMPGKVFLTQQPEMAFGFNMLPNLVPELKVLNESVPVLAAIPLTVDKKRLGVFGISSDTLSQTGVSEDEMISVMSGFVNHVAAAIDTAMLFEEKQGIGFALQNTVQRLHVLNEIGMDLVSDLDLSTIMNKVVRYAAEIVGADAAVVSLTSKAGTGTETVFAYNMPPCTEELFLRISSDDWLAFLEYPNGVIDNNYPEQLWALNEFVEAGIKCAMLSPISSKGKMLAVISVASYSDERKFTEHDLEALRVLSRQVAIAIENAKLYQHQIKASKKMETYANQLRLLNILLEDITRETDTHKMLLQLADGARHLLNCSAANAVLYKDSQECDSVLSRIEGDRQICKVGKFEMDFSSHDGLYSEMFRTKKPIRLEDVLTHPRSKGLPNGHLGVRGYLGSPLIDTSGNFIGQVACTDKLDGSQFTETDEELLLALCTQVAIAIEKTEAYEREHSIAEVLQQAILASPESLPGIEIGIIYESAAEAAKVGGDFYDLFELGDDKIGIVIGDVSGKGLKAATITSMVKSTIRAFAYKGLSPSQTLNEANRVISKQLGINQFVTMMYGVLDPGSGKLVISRAGHPQAIIWRADRCHLCEDESNLPLGITPDVDFCEHEVALPAGDGVILYTDGLVEANHKKQILSEDKLIAELSDFVKDGDPQKVAFSLVNMAKEFADGKIQDDIAIVVLKVKEER